eukprot:TRINITY_DN703_c0_g1_i3.p2 TRINITY_DN703_c0_g1~~TRINITY_DN703_c0_g1_i3.p2  ORF type:complete len:145 (+),score=27.89 TRINITY_DN703_c0_g1_i3:163-597(+)
MFDFCSCIGHNVLLFSKQRRSRNRVAKADKGDMGTMFEVTQFGHGGAVEVDRSRDELLTEFGKATLVDRYLMPGESYQDLFARVASFYGDDKEHAQRLYNYISKLWFMPATPVLCVDTVSYTHLRAHETVLDLVCRLLLEKKKK